VAIKHFHRVCRMRLTTKHIHVIHVCLSWSGLYRALSIEHRASSIVNELIQREHLVRKITRSALPKENITKLVDHFQHKTRKFEPRVLADTRQTWKMKSTGCSITIGLHVAFIYACFAVQWTISNRADVVIGCSQIIFSVGE